MSIFYHFLHAHLQLTSWALLKAYAKYARYARKRKNMASVQKKTWNNQCRAVHNREKTCSFSPLSSNTGQHLRFQMFFEETAHAKPWCKLSQYFSFQAGLRQNFDDGLELFPTGCMLWKTRIDLGVERKSGITKIGWMCWKKALDLFVERFSLILYPLVQSCGRTAHCRWTYLDIPEDGGIDKDESPWQLREPVQCVHVLAPNKYGIWWFPWEPTKIMSTPPFLATKQWCWNSKLCSWLLWGWWGWWILWISACPVRFGCAIKNGQTENRTTQFLDSSRIKNFNGVPDNTP